MTDSTQAAVVSRTAHHGLNGLSLNGDGRPSLEDTMAATLDSLRDSETLEIGRERLERLEIGRERLERLEIGLINAQKINYAMRLIVADLEEGDLRDTAPASADWEVGPVSLDEAIATLRSLLEQQAGPLHRLCSEPE